MIVVIFNRIMFDFIVFERIFFVWSLIIFLMWVCGRYLYECVEEENDNFLEKDIVIKMRFRVLLRYGFDIE